MNLATALNNGWLREMDAQRYIALHTQSLTSTQSADGSTTEAAPVPPHETPILPHADVAPVIIPIEENVRDMVLKRRSVRIGKLARKRVSLYWLYRSGFERDMPVSEEE